MAQMEVMNAASHGEKNGVIFWGFQSLRVIDPTSY